MIKQRQVIYLEPEQLALLQRLKAKTGVPITEMCRRAVAAWLEKVKAEAVGR